MSARVVLLLIVMSLMVGVASAGVLRVEQGGSGEYLLIQDAVDAAADGDTILIGPGRYDDLQPRGVNNVVCVAFCSGGSDLTFIGESADSVILGSTSYAPAGTGPQGIHQRDPANIRVESISFENLKGGVVAGDASLYVEGARFDTGDYGVYVQDPDSCFVRNCTFRDFSEKSVAVFRAAYAEIVGCELFNAEIYFGGTLNGIIRNCTVIGGELVNCYQTSGLIEGCDVQCSGSHQCIGITDCDTIRIRDNTIVGGTVNVAIIGADTNVTADHNEFSSPTVYANFDLGFEASLIAHDNHIRVGDGLDYIIVPFGYPEGNTATIDLGGNYWFEHSTPAQLDALIYDGNDHPDLHVIVNYDPIRTEPVPAEKPSFGGLKSMYLGR